jgi:hypothetical protein
MTDADDLTLAVSWQIEIAREDVARIVSLPRLTVALGPSFIVKTAGI